MPAGPRQPLDGAASSVTTTRRSSSARPTSTCSASLRPADLHGRPPDHGIERADHRARREPPGRHVGVNWTLTTKVPLHDAEGNVVGLLGITREINELKRTELNLQHLATHDSADRPAEPLSHDRPAGSDPRVTPSGPARSSPSCSWTSTTSRRSTTPTATSSAISSSRRSPEPSSDRPRQRHRGPDRGRRVRRSSSDRWGMPGMRAP